MTFVEFWFAFWIWLFFFWDHSIPRKNPQKLKNRPLTLSVLFRMRFQIDTVAPKKKTRQRLEIALSSFFLHLHSTF